MQLDQYISDLLYRYECVILPGFGAFLTQYQSAQVHQTTNAFYPPKKRLSFNSQLTDSDGLLANYIAKSEVIPHEEASNRIQTYVRFLFDRLHKGEHVTFENIGSFDLNEDNNLQFEPSHHLNYLTSSFGLSSFTTPALAREVYKEQVTALEEKAPIAITPERRNNGWIKYAAAGVILFAALGLGGFNYVKNVENHNFAAQQEASEKVDAKIQEATFVLENPLPAIRLKLAKPQGNYHVVAGAFSAEANADKCVSQLKAKGYKARRVGYGSFTTGSEALIFLRKVRKDDNKSAWMDIRKIEE